MGLYIEGLNDSGIELIEKAKAIETAKDLLQKGIYTISYNREYLVIVPIFSEPRMLSREELELGFSIECRRMEYEVIFDRYKNFVEIKKR